MSIDLGEMIRVIRIAKGLRIKDVAGESQISSPFLTLVEQGERRPSLTVLKRLAESLCVPVDAFLLASPEFSETLSSTDSRAERIVASVGRMRAIQDELRHELESPPKDADED